MVGPTAILTLYTQIQITNYVPFSDELLIIQVIFWYQASADFEYLYYEAFAAKK